MSEHLRPPESESIGEELRTQLEGRIELLEDGLHLFDSVLRALAREPLGDDEVATLREAALQLPRLEAAQEIAQRHEASSALARAMASRKSATENALRARLADAFPSLATGLRALVEHTQRHRPPAADETRLLESRTHLWPALVVGALVAGIDRIGHGDWSRWWVGGLLAAGLLLLLRRAPGWVLLGDRIYVGGLNVQVHDITSVERHFFGNVAVHAGKDRHLIDADAQPLLALMRTQWMVGLGSRRAATVHDAEDGVRLVSSAGELTVLHERGALAVQSLGGREVTLHQLFALLALLPPTQLGLVATQLVSHADAQWQAPAAR